ncbi:MAG: hypothetical protein Q4C81_10240 [Kocuria sp.]|nr:hypothetical protein [Kocuria sp.]
MSNSGIDFSEFPSLADADAVEEGAKKIRDAGQAVQDKAKDIDGAWRALEYSYSAPETQTLVTALLPTTRDGESVRDNAKTVYDALKTYAETERDLKKQLQTLKNDVGAFEASIAGDDEWDKDEHKINERNGLIDRMNGLKTAHDEAANTCANTINNIYGGVQYRTMPDDGAPAPPGVEYNGMSKDLLNSATAAGHTPWATNVEWDKPWYRDTWDGITQFGVGLWESLKGAVTGTLALINPFDWDTFSSTWKGIGTLSLDVATVITPIGLFRGAEAQAESRDRLVEVGKAAVNLEEWKTDPAKAAGMLTGDVLLAVGTGGAGAALKTTSVAGKAGKLAGAGKAGGGRAIDFSKALAANPKAVVGDIAFDTKYKAIDLGLSMAEKAVPKIAPAVQTINKFKNDVVDYSLAAKDTISSIHWKPTHGLSFEFGGQPRMADGGPALGDNYRLEMSAPPSLQAGTSFRDALTHRTEQRAAAVAAKQSEPNILELRPSKKWANDPSRMRQYHAKVDHLNNEARQGKLEYTKVDKRSSPRRQYVDQPELLDRPDDFNPDKLKDYDLDHKTDLQLGGLDNADNYQWLDKRVNRSVGAQLRWQMIKKGLNQPQSREDRGGSKIDGISDASRPDLLKSVGLEAHP